MMKVTVLVCLVMSVSSFAAESKSDKHALGFTKEQHMAAVAACKAINADMQGKVLKECIKEKLNIKAQ